MKRSSIKDIAKLAGVSVATVSYVLNRKEGQRISEETRKKFLKLLKRLTILPIRSQKALKPIRQSCWGSSLQISPTISTRIWQGILKIKR
ncbi:LacI family DNA-binding transcriptional regulator [Chryseobacterium sp. 1B4]